MNAIPDIVTTGCPEIDEEVVGRDIVLKAELGEQLLQVIRRSPDPTRVN